MDIDDVANTADQFRQRIVDLEDHIEMHSQNAIIKEQEDNIENERRKFNAYRSGVADILAQLHNDTIPKEKITQLVQEGDMNMEVGDAKAPPAVDREPLKIP